MLSTYIMGGLGNQLFQVFSLISSSIDSNLPFVIPYYEKTHDGFQRKTYWNTFLKYINSYTSKTITNNIITYNEPEFAYRPLPTKCINNETVMYKGYFQSDKYFKNNYDKICDLIHLNELQNDVKLKYGDDHLIKSKINVSLHFRLGDYKINQNYYPLIQDEYYINALTYIIKHSNLDINVVYFCEQEDEELINVRINNIKLKLPTISFVKCSNKLDDFEQMLLMSLCEHNIIANSTFSWWGAYFNNNTNKIVVYPSGWFGPKLSHLNLIDLHPETWTKINS